MTEQEVSLNREELNRILELIDETLSAGGFSDVSEFTIKRNSEGKVQLIFELE